MAKRISNIHAPGNVYNNIDADKDANDAPREELDPLEFPPRMRSAMDAYGGVVGEVLRSGPGGSHGASTEAASINKIFNDKYSADAIVNIRRGIVSTAGPTPFLGGPDVPRGAGGSPGGGRRDSTGDR